MKFTVPQGTKAKALIKGGTIWSRCDITTSKENIFVESDVIIDPTGHLACGPESKTVGGSLAMDGLYGFKRGDKILLVHKHFVRLQGVYDLADDLEEEESSE